MKIKYLGQGVALVALLALDVVLDVQPLFHEAFLVGGTDDVPAQYGVITSNLA